MEVESAGTGMTGQLALDERTITDEQKTDLEATRGDEGTVDDAPRSIIAAHRVDGYAHSANGSQLTANS